MATVMVWKTNAFGSFRVLVEKISVNGMATLIKFTRDERYRPAEAGRDGTMWVASSTLHKATPRPAKESRPAKAAPKATAPKKAATKSRTRTATAVQEF
jgi:hypothetical protein